MLSESGPTVLLHVLIRRGWVLGFSRIFPSGYWRMFQNHGPTELINTEGNLKWKIPPGEWTIMRFVCANTGIKNDWGKIQRWCDLMIFGCIDRHQSQNRHRKYGFRWQLKLRSWCSKYVSIRGLYWVIWYKPLLSLSNINPIGQTSSWFSVWRSERCFSVLQWPNLKIYGHLTILSEFVDSTVSEAL